MKLRKLPMLFAALFLLSLHVSGQATPNREKMPGNPDTLKPGVVVEAIEKNSEGERAGLQEGDILLGWVRGSVSGRIESPFSLSWIDIEQRPRGAVTLEGLRNGEPQVWTIGSKYWGITARPDFPQTLLALYTEGKDLADAGKIIQASERWRNVASAVSNQSLQLSAWLLFCTAELLSKTEQWKESDDAYQQALAMVSASRPQNGAFLLFAWALSFGQRGDRNKAEKYYQQAVTESQKWGDENLTANCLTNLGFLEMDRSELAKAEGYLRQALEIYERIEPDSLQVAPGLLNMGMIAIERGDLADAEEWELRGLAVFRKLAPHGNGVLVALNNLGEVARGRGEFDRAEEFYLEALTIKEKSAPDAPVLATFLQNLGIVAELRGNPRQAEEYLQRALTILQKLASGSSNDDMAGGATIASTLKYLGDVAQHRGDLAKAEEFFNKALAIKEKIAPEGLFVAEILNGLGDVSRNRGDLAKAEIYYRHALEIREKLAPGRWEHAETLADLAWTMRQTRQEDVAADLYQEALNALESQMGHLGGAEETRFDFRATHESYYKEYIDLLVSRKQVDLAFHIVERSRARTLLEMLAAAHVDVRKGVDSTLLDQERSLQDLLRGKVNSRVRLLSSQHTEKQIQTLDGEIAGLLRQQENVEARIRASSPSYSALTQPQPLNAQGAQRLLPDNTLLLEYSLGKTSSYVFAVTARSLNGYKLPPGIEIESKAQHLYQFLTERSRIVQTENDRQRRTRLRKADAGSRRAAVELSRIVLGPLAAELQQRRLLVVSDGALQYIPFAALPTPELSPRNTPYPLIVQHEIVNLPSASVLAFLRQNTTANKEVAVFADPVFDNRDSRVKSDAARLAAVTDTVKQNVSQDKPLSVQSPQLANLARSVADMNPGQKGEIHLPRLAFTRDEAKAILAVVRPGSGMEALDFDASRKRAMSGELARYRVVHFATHALVDNIHPELSGLVLSLVDQTGEPEDGFLGLQDIYNLDLSADLVVLSACQTALGKEINGEGMIGLTRGFMNAGASGVMATLWNVNDFATAKLMAHFYKAMEQDGMTPAQALRQAQLALWKEQSSSAPYYWAGFILQGGWQ